MALLLIEGYVRGIHFSLLVPECGQPSLFHDFFYMNSSQVVTFGRVPSWVFIFGFVIESIIGVPLFSCESIVPKQNLYKYGDVEWR